MARNIGRRKFLKDASIAAAGITMSPLVTRAWAARPLSLFLGCPFTGGYASLSKYLVMGMELAVEKFGGKVLNRPIEIIKGDAASPEAGVRVAREAVEKHGCRLLTVAPSSNTALAVSEYAHKVGAVLMAHGGSDRITGADCNRSTFRWEVPTWGAVRAVVPVVIDQYRAKTFYAITPKYVFGEDLLRNTRKILAEKRYRLLGNSYHPIGENNFAEHVARAKASGADCVLLLNFGGDTVNFLKQAYIAGLINRSAIACVWGAGIKQMSTVNPYINEGVFWGLQYYYTLPTEANRLFVKSFKARYGQFPSYLSAATYTTTISLLDSVSRAGTDEPEAVINALEGYRYAGLTGREVYRKCDHQCVKPFYVVRGKKEADMNHPHDFADIVGYSVNLQPCDSSGCDIE